jgi:hypothetical protein
MTEERATMNAIENTRQLFNARLETLEAKIDGKLAMIFRRLDAMPDRAEMHKAISEATDDLRKLIIWGSIAACGSILSLMFVVRALNIDSLGQGFEIAQYVNERETKRIEELRSLRQLMEEEAIVLHKLREELLQKPAPHRP